jgi:hypothetical protein
VFGAALPTPSVIVASSTVVQDAGAGSTRLAHRADLDCTTSAPLAPLLLDPFTSPPPIHPIDDSLSQASTARDEEEDQERDCDRSSRDRDPGDAEHCMGEDDIVWTDRVVFVQDFAYPARGRRGRIDSCFVGYLSAGGFARLLSGTMLDIYVGPQRRHWSLHRNLLCHHSPYLASRLHTSTSKIDLPTDDPAGFELLIKWLYQGKLDDVENLADPYAKYDYAVACYKLYLLCIKWEMNDAKNAAMDCYRAALASARLVPDADEIAQIYESVPPTDPMRVLVVRIAARQIMDPENEKDAEDYRQCFEIGGKGDFAVELVNAIRRGTGGLLLEDPTEDSDDAGVPGRGKCEYHEHWDGEFCGDGATGIKLKGKGRAGAFYVLAMRIHIGIPALTNVQNERRTPTHQQSYPRRLKPSLWVSRLELR